MRRLFLLAVLLLVPGCARGERPDERLSRSVQRPGLQPGGTAPVDMSNRPASAAKAASL